jgi:hypothetical protein
VKHICTGVFFRGLLPLLIILQAVQCSFAQNYNGVSILYNSLLGGVSAGAGAVINKNKDQKWHKVFARGFITGVQGGAVMYAGKRLNSVIVSSRDVSYAWLSRAVFCAGNSIVENAANNRKFWTRWHYDIGFVRVEYDVIKRNVRPFIMPSDFLGTVFIAFNGQFDLKNSLLSGAPVFFTDTIAYARGLLGSTTGNGFIITTRSRGSAYFYELFAHEMVHTFQFREFSAANSYFNPLKERWKQNFAFINKWSKWLYIDVHYEMMLLNYFLVNRGYKGSSYCNNLLENEAESLSTGRTACP